MLREQANDLLRFKSSGTRRNVDFKMATDISDELSNINFRF